MACMRCHLAVALKMTPYVSKIEHDGLVRNDIVIESNSRKHQQTSERQNLDLAK